MKYFVSIENTSYFYWQIELLIESFKMHGLENDLHIAIAENESPKLNMYFKNISSHKNLYLHENVGRKKECLSLNRIYSLEKLVREEVLTYPFVVIHSDMVLKKPLKIENDDTNIITNTYQIENKEIDEIINLEEIKKYLISSGYLSSLGDFYYSHPIVFNNTNGVTDSFKENFFKYLIYEIEVMLLEKKNSKKELFEMAAWKKNLLNATGHFKISGNVLSCNITDNLDVPFVHYNKGILPIFSKRFFKHEQATKALFLSGIDDPLHQLLNLRNVSEHAEYVAKVIESYKKN